MSDHCEISGARLPRPGRGESLSMDEAAAFRAGAEAMREAAAKWHEAEAALAQNYANRRVSEQDAREWQITADYHRDCAKALGALPLPEPPASLQADGLCGRGA